MAKTVSGRDQGDESKRTIVEVVGAVKLFPCAVVKIFV
jgi:hypothetical protein